ncbi:hypothetical protein CK203_086524 [Vitis vinifera]|uniref:Uncharacterized protein n=1 Tax=Vitis vinifera TaxID=29760 RepID=A0A438EIG2_VITVI|nr:hypothetical protein CK203_086524 [Vitis vinifera]
MEELAVELGCRVRSLPSQYLGLPLGVLNRAPYMWDGVEERVRRRLALWKRQYISKGGRVTLIKSTLASMPIYQMSIFRMPKMVARRLEKVQRDFFDQGEVWAGGFWVEAKEGYGGGGVGVWKEIWKESEWCWNNMIFKVGKGNTIRFWTDVWCSETALSHCFPHLFAMAVQRNSTVEEMWDRNSDFEGSQTLWGRRFSPVEKRKKGAIQVVRVLWDIVFGLVDVKWVFPETVEEVLVSWRGEEAFSLIGFLEWMASP